MATATSADIVSAIGATIEVITGAPATYTEAGFAALFGGSESKVGMIEDFTTPESSTSEETFEDLENGEIIKVSTFTDAGTATIVAGHVIDDDGQAVLISHHNGTDKGTTLSVKIAHPDGAITYYAGKVTGYAPVRNPLNRVTYTVSVTKKMVEVAA